MLTLAFNIQSVKAGGTIYIRADGSIDPPDAPISTVDNVTYTLTGNITSTADGIVVLRSNIIIDGAGYTLQGIGALSTGIHVESGSNVTIKNAKIKGFESGISFFGYTPALKFSKVVGNYIVNNSYGILGGGFSYNIAGNNIINNTWGVKLFASSNNTIVGNNIIANNKGITLWDGSSNNSIFGNNMESNSYGIMLVYGSSNNKIFHNDFINNAYQAYDSFNNTWDDGYPSGGNFWDDYDELDTNGDGIGDVPYIIDTDNQDRYPLTAPFGSIPIIWDEKIYPVELKSNSTISRFNFNATQRIISFNVTGPDYTLGFCNITIPNNLVQDLWQGNFTVLVDGKEPLIMNNWTDGSYTYIYFTYQHSTHEVIIIPEFPPVIIMPLLMALTMLVAAVAKKRKPKI
jgi:parallel beta-helix repeat protein